MKKVCVILIFAIAAFVFVGCGDDETAVRWRKNTGGDFVNQIKWTDESNVAKQTWSETLTSDGERTGFESVPNKTGKGFAFFQDEGDEAQININGGSGSVTLSEGESQELEISGYTKK